MPFLALLEADLRVMIRSWVVRIWMGLLAFHALITVMEALNEGNPADTMANQYRTFLLVWSTFVIVISSGAVSSESGVVADSILSKAVTRYEYILAKMSARLLTIIGIYLAAVLPPAYIIPRNVPVHFESDAIIWTVIIVGTYLVLLTNLAVTFSTIFNRTMVVVVVVWILWYLAGALVTLLGIDYLSPILFLTDLPMMLQGDYDPADLWRILSGVGIPAFGVVLGAVIYFNRKDL